MDQENKNVEATNEEKALQSFLDGTNDYEEEKAPEAPKLVMNKGEILISALSLFALAMWTLSNYGPSNRVSGGRTPAVGATHGPQPWVITHGNSRGCNPREI